MLEAEKSLPGFIVAFLAAMIMTWGLGLMIIFSVYNYGTDYDLKVLFFTLLIIGLWTLLFCFRYKKEGGFEQYGKIELSAIFFFISIIFVFIANALWGGNFLSLNPVEGICSGRQFVDSVWHSALAAGWASYGKSTLLVNSTVLLTYHSFSHLIFGIFSKVLAVPTFFVYNYFYPLVFMPLYVFLIFAVAVEARKFFSIPAKLNLSDVFVVCAFIVGFMPMKHNIAYVFFSWELIVGESIAVAHVFCLLYFYILFHYGRKDGPVQKVLFYIVTPVFFCLCFWTKISAGALFIAGVMYYIFRKHTKQIYYWGVNLLYLIFFVVTYCLRMGTFSVLKGGIVTSGDVPLVASASNTSLKDFLLSVIAYSLTFSTAIILFVCGIRKKHPTVKQFLLSSDLIKEETVAIVVLASFLPLFLHSFGNDDYKNFFRSAYFFSCWAFLAMGYPEKIKHFLWKNKIARSISCVVLAVLTLSMVINSSPKKVVTGYVKNVFTRQKGIKEKIAQEGIAKLPAALWQSNYDLNTDSTFFKNIEEINRITYAHKKDYALFVDEDAELWDINYYSGYPLVKKDPLVYCFIYPAMTSLLCLNEVYNEGNKCFNRDDCLVGLYPFAYSFGLFADDRKKNLEEVMASLPPSIKKVIHLHGNTFDILDANAK